MMSLFPEYTLSTTQSIIDQVRASQIKVDFIDRFYQFVLESSLGLPVIEGRI